MIRYSDMKTLRTLITEKTQTVEALIGMIQAGRFPDLKAMAQFLEKNGKPLKKIGSGWFSDAFVGTDGQPDWVLKVLFKKDPGYEEFLRVAMAQSSSLYPKVRKPFVLGGRKCVFVEHLHINKSELSKNIRYLVRQHAPESFEKYKDSSSTTATLVFKYLMPEFAEGNEGLSIIFEEMGKKHGFTAKDILDYYRQVSGIGKWDLHGDNVGIRKNGEMVFFDPVSFAEDAA